MIIIQALTRLLPICKNSGIKVLRDSCVVAGNKLLIIGRDDLTNQNRKSLASLLEGQDAGLPLLCLITSHTAWMNQLRTRLTCICRVIPITGRYFLLTVLCREFMDLGYGYRKTGNTHQYVSSGIGLWAAPIRLGTQSEIVKIYLKSVPVKK